MTSQHSIGPRARDLTRAGLYTIAGYYLLFLLQLPFQLPLPKTLPMGPFTIEGNGVLIGVILTAGIWTLMLVGLVTRRRWGYLLAIVVLAVHVLLVVGGVHAWITEYGMETFRKVWQVVVFPSLQWVFTDALVVIYLVERKDLFRREGVRDVAVA